MKSYLMKKVGEKLGITRAGMPKESYFDAVLKEVLEDAAVFEDSKGNQIVVPLDKILMVGPEPSQESDKTRPGFMSKPEGK